MTAPKNSEQDLLRSRIDDLTRTLTVCRNLATQCYADSSASYQRALRWDRNAADTGHLLAMAFKRLWAIKGADNVRQ
jgi:hypothetical protein